VICTIKQAFYGIAGKFKNYIENVLLLMLDMAIERQILEWIL